MGKVAESEREVFAQDGSVDLRGNPVLRSERGSWKACHFIIVYEVFERMAYYGISSNLMIYLTQKLHQGTVSSANNVTNWAGTVWLTPIIGAYIADAHLGRYWTFLFASFIYLMGMGLLTLSVSLPSLKPPPCIDMQGSKCEKASTLQLAVFFGALYILAVGTGGTKPNISTIGADQFDEFDPKEKIQKFSFFNWWMFSIFLGTLFANSVLIYIQDNVGWALGYGISTVGLAISLIIFIAGTPFYRHKLPSGSPITKMVRVLVATLRKRSISLPTNPEDLYELEPQEHAKKMKSLICSTSSLRFLNKAAVRTTSPSSWNLSTVTQVEETKHMIRMVPIFLATIIPCVMIAQINTLFVKQGTTLNRSLGHNFKVPPASLAIFVTLSMLVSVMLYERYFVRFMRKLTKNPRGITLLQRMGVGIFLQILVMISASLTEQRRLSIARDHGLVENGGELPTSIFILLPQFVLMGISDAFFTVASVEFFYDQAPESMKSLGASYSTTSLGLGNFFSSFLLKSLSKVTEKNGNGWILNNLNNSHLDYYYGFFTILCILNFIFFLLVAKFYEYRADVSSSMEDLVDPEI